MRTDGLSDRCITRAKIGFDISEVPEGGGRVVMTEEQAGELGAGIAAILNDIARQEAV